MSYEQDISDYTKAITPIPTVPAAPAWQRPKFQSLCAEILWCSEIARLFVGPPKPQKEKIVQHEIYGYNSTSDRQRAYLVKHGIKHVRKDGEYR